MDNNQGFHGFVTLTGAPLTETFTPSAVERKKVIAVTLKFSDVLTQDTLYIRRLNVNDVVVEEYGKVLFEESATATRFTWAPPEGAMKIAPGEQIQVVFANNNSRTLTAIESNVTYESI